MAEAIHEGQAAIQSLNHLHERIHIELIAIEHRAVQRDIGGNRHCRLNFFLSSPAARAKAACAGMQ